MELFEMIGTKQQPRTYHEKIYCLLQLIAQGGKLFQILGFLQSSVEPALEPHPSRRFLDRLQRAIDWSSTIGLSSSTVHALDHPTEVSLEADESELIVLDLRVIESHHHLLSPLLCKICKLSGLLLVRFHLLSS